MKYYAYFSALAITLFSLQTGCTSQPENKGNDIVNTVSVIELEKGSINQLIHTTGTAAATYEVTLNSEISGLYGLQTNPRTGKPFKLGDKVKKGEAVIRLQDKEYENGIAIESKKLNLEIAEQEQAKQKALYEKGGVTLSEMRNTEVKVTGARYDYENGILGLGKMNAVVPFDGVIVDLPHYTPGVRIEQGKPLVSIMAYSQLYMEINLPESSIGYVKPRQTVFITHYTLPDDTLKGIISELSPAVSTETRTFKGKVTIQNPALLLRPGMFVKADIVVDKADSALIIPKEVIQSVRRKKYVYIVEKNRAFMREIETGLEDENRIEITKGLKEKDNLVIRGFETLRQNSKVKVQK